MLRNLTDSKDSISECRMHANGVNYEWGTCIEIFVVQPGHCSAKAVINILPSISNSVHLPLFALQNRFQSAKQPQLHLCMSICNTKACALPWHCHACRQVCRGTLPTNPTQCFQMFPSLVHLFFFMPLAIPQQGNATVTSTQICFLPWCVDLGSIFPMCQYSECVSLTQCVVLAQQCTRSLMGLEGRTC